MTDVFRCFEDGKELQDWDCGRGHRGSLGSTEEGPGVRWSLLEKRRNHHQVVAFCWLFISGGREPEREGRLGWGWFACEAENACWGTRGSLTLLGPAGCSLHTAHCDSFHSLKLIRLSHLSLVLSP